MHPIPGLLYSAPLAQSLTQVDACVCGGEAIPPPSPSGTSNLQPVLLHVGVVSSQNWLTGELCVAVSPISWQRNLNLCGSPRSSSESRRPLDVTRSACHRPCWAVPTSGARGGVRVSEMEACVDLYRGPGTIPRQSTGGRVAVKRDVFITAGPTIKAPEK